MHAPVFNLQNTISEVGNITFIWWGNKAWKSINRIVGLPVNPLVIPGPSPLLPLPPSSEHFVTRATCLVYGFHGTDTMVGVPRCEDGCCTRRFATCHRGSCTLAATHRAGWYTKACILVLSVCPVTLIWVTDNIKVIILIWSGSCYHSSAVDVESRYKVWEDMCDSLLKVWIWMPYVTSPGVLRCIILVPWLLIEGTALMPSARGRETNIWDILMN